MTMPKIPSRKTCYTYGYGPLKILARLIMLIVHETGVPEIPLTSLVNWEEPSMDQYQCRGETLRRTFRTIGPSEFPQEKVWTNDWSI